MSNDPNNPGPPTPPGNQDSRTGRSENAERTAQESNRVSEDLRIGIERNIRLKELEEERLLIIGQVLEASKKRLQLQTSELSKLESTLQILTDESTTMEQMLKYGDKLVIQFDTVGKTMDKNSAAFKKFQDIQARSLVLQEEIKKITGTTEADLARKKQLQEELAGIYKEQAVDFEKLRADIQDVENFATQIDSSFDSIGQSMGITADMSRTTSGNFAKMAADLATGLSEDKFAQVGKGLEQFATGVIFSLVDKIGEMAIALDKTGKELQSSTGYTTSFNSQLMAVTEATVTFGGTMEEASAAVGALSKNFRAFNPEADAANQVMAENIVLLEKFGVGSASTAKMIDQLSKSQGMSGEAASEMTMKIVTAGRKIGIEASQMAQDFAATHDALVQFGDDADEIFLGMAAQAKAAGLEVSNLVTIAKGFDTFEGAADKVGKLNAIMGTSLSALDLMNADYEETINLLRQGTQSLDFDSMNRFEKQYLATALGVQSVDEAQRLLTMSTSDYLAHQAEMENNAATQKELAAAAEAMVPVTQRLEIAFSNIVVAMAPLITYFAELMDMISEYPNLFSSVILVLTLATATVKIYTLYTTIMTAKTVLLELATAGATGAELMKQAAEKTGIGISMIQLIYTTLVTKSKIALGFASLFAAGAALFLIVAFIALVKIMTKPNSPPLYLIFGVIALGVIGLGLALYFIQGPAQLTLLLLVGLAVGMSMMFYSIKLLVDSLTGFFQMLIENVASLPLVAAGLYMMAGAFAAMGIAAMLSLGSVVLLLAALTGIGAIFIGGMMLAGFETLGALAGYMTQIGTGMEKFATGLEKVKVVTSLLQQIGKDAFVAVSVKGDTTTAVIAPKDMIPDISNGIDINIKVNVPQPIVYVNIDGKDIPSKVDKARSTPSIFDKAIGNAMGAA